MFDLDKLNLEKMQIIQNVLQRKTKQEQLRKERRKMEVFHDIKEIFVEAFDIIDVNHDQTIV